MGHRILSSLSWLAIATTAIADPPPTPAGALRVATYNVAMWRETPGELAAELRRGSPQARRIAEVIQRVRPDLLLVCEIDYDTRSTAPRLFRENYLKTPQAEGLEPIDFPHLFAPPVNTGVPTGLDLDADGDPSGPNDAYGYGRYPGQYGMAVYSRLPIDREATRTFQRLLWSELPGARRPVDPSRGEPYYDEQAWPRLRLPSKSLIDVVVRLPDGGPLHLVGSHPTPPVFDGPEDRNGCRNADELRLVYEYLEGTLPEYFIDDKNRAGAVAAGEPLVVLGDLNADPTDGDGIQSEIRRLLVSPRLAEDPRPASRGAIAASEANPALNLTHRGDPALDTGDFSADEHANLRIDYALPSKELRVVGGGVFWPAPGEPGADAAAASDHRLVWVDIAP